MAKVVVTGGAGFIGSHLVDALVARGDEVIVADSFIKQANPDKSSVLWATHYVVDIRDFYAMKSLLNGATCVYHLAALPRVQFSIENPVDTHDTNVTGTLSVLEAARQAGVKRVVFASSSSVYGMRAQMPLKETDPLRPISPYAAQKLMGEILCKMYTDVYGLDTVCLRYFNVYGPRLDPNGPYALVIGVFLRQWLAGEPLTITGDGTQTRDFTHVSDVVRATLLAGDPNFIAHGRAINIGAGHGVSINDLAKMFGDPTEYIAARNEPHDTRADNSLARRLLDWEPKVRIEDGIADLKASVR